MPDSVLDGGTYGCMNLIPDLRPLRPLRGLRYSWARQKTETGTEERHQSTIIGAAQSTEKKRHDSDITSAHQDLEI